MRVSSLLILLLGPYLALGIMYGPQPLLPLLAEFFELTDTQAASLITSSLLALTVGPLASGFLMRFISPRRLIAIALLALGVTEILHAYSQVFSILLLLRFFQGGIIAAILAGSMTYIASSADNLKQTMAYYVASTIIGGLGGRIMAGYLSSQFGWPTFFTVMGILCIVSGLLVFLLPAETRQNTASKGGDFREVITKPLIMTLCGVVFCGFFVMTAVLNYIPFRLEDLNPLMGEQTIALFYTGFVVGFSLTLIAPRLTEMAGGSLPASLVGMGILAFGTLLSWVPSTLVVFVAVIFVTSGFFVTHAVIAPFLNALDPVRAGLINSLYISIYYIGGTIGSYVPGLVYEQAGWTYFILALMAVMVVGGLMVVRARRLELSRQ